MRVYHVLLPVLALALGGCTMEGSTPAATPAAMPQVTQAVAPASGFGGLLNAARAQAGLPAATTDARLQAAAVRHVRDMVENDFFDHGGSDGTRSYDRIAQAGYSSCRPAENIAFGATSEAAVFEMWMGSSGHRANMLMTGNVQYGLAQMAGKWVMTVARVC